MLSTITGLLEAHGTDRFWEILSAGWISEHVRPGELAVEGELEKLFGDQEPERILRFSENSIKDGVYLKVGGGRGYWRFEGIEIGTEKRPGVIRRALMGAVVGAVWIEREEV